MPFGSKWQQPFAHPSVLQPQQHAKSKGPSSPARLTLVLFSIAKKSAVTVLAMPNSAHDSWSASSVSRRLRLGC